MKTKLEQVNKGMLAAKEEYFSCLKTYFNDNELPSYSFGPAGLSLANIKHLKFDEELVKSSLAIAVKEAAERTPKAITDSFINIYPRAISDKEANTTSNSYDIDEEVKKAIEELNKKEDRTICYQYSSFCTHTLPLSQTDKKEIVTEFPNNKMTVSSIGDETLPWGGIPRLIILYINTMAVLNGSDTISLGNNIKDFVESLGYRASYIEGGTNEQVMDQLEKLYKTEFGHERHEKVHLEDGSVEIKRHQKSFKIFDEKSTFEVIQGNFVEKQEATVKLSDTYFKELKAHPVPLSLETIKALKKSPLALDLYAFISYRANTKRTIALKLKDLMKQFGIETETWRFKSNVTRALELLSKQWPECNVVIKNNAMVILPTQTQIPA